MCRLLLSPKTNIFSAKFGRCNCANSSRKYTSEVNTNQSDETCSERQRRKSLADAVVDLTKTRLQEMLKDPVYAAAYEQLQSNLEIAKYMGWAVPEVIKPQQIIHLLQLSKSKQQKYLEILCKRMMVEQQRLANKLERSKDMRSYESSREKMTYYDGEQVYYGLHRNAMFLRLYRSTMNTFESYKLMYAMMFDSPLVIDLDYEDLMVCHEKSALSKQLMFLYGANRRHRQPFNLTFLTTQTDSETMLNLFRHIPSMYKNELIFNVVDKPLCEAFDSRKLIYLTPDSQNTMTRFDHEAIYVIGGLVDKGRGDPFTLAKAKRHKLKTQKFPLHMLEWQQGKKSLTLDQVGNILLDFRMTNNWHYAFRHLPMRKLTHRQQQELRFNMRNE